MRDENQARLVAVLFLFLAAGVAWQTFARGMGWIP